jgi:hypothetical protein
VNLSLSEFSGNCPLPKINLKAIRSLFLEFSFFGDFYIKLSGVGKSLNLTLLLLPPFKRKLKLGPVNKPFAVVQVVRLSTAKPQPVCFLKSKDCLGRNTFKKLKRDRRNGILKRYFLATVILWLADFSIS